MYTKQNKQRIISLLLCMPMKPTF